MSTPTGTPNSKGNMRGQMPSQREALSRGRKVHRSRRGYSRPRQIVGLQGEASIALSGRLRRFVEAYDDDPSVLGKVAVGQLLADLWDANTFLKPIWLTVRRLAKRIDDQDRRANGKNGNEGGDGNGGGDEDSAEGDLKALADLDAMVPLMDQLGRWHKRTTDVALRLAELEVRLRGSGGSGGYLEDKYGGEPGGDGQEPAEAEVHPPPRAPRPKRTRKPKPPAPAPTAPHVGPEDPPCAKTPSPFD